VSNEGASRLERAAVVVPVKSFELAKGRLAGALSAERRAELARRMAAGVVRAAAPLPVWVVCDSSQVASWAAAEGAGLIWRRVEGLNAAVTAATAFLAADGYDHAIVAHGDLPLATELAWLAEMPGVTIVPDRRGDGTNVLALPTRAGFRFAYGPGSSGRHRQEAERLGLAVRIVADERLGWDVDTPEDLAVFDTDPANLANRP
jgi:2-phospho-L-lactate guanylyltransferase